MIGNKTLLTASNLNSAYISQTNTSPQYMNSTLTLSGGALTLKNSILTDNASASYFRIDPQGNNVIVYDGVNNQRLDVFSSSGSESTYLTTVNGTPSVGHLDVSSAIDHLEINTLSVKPVTVGANLSVNGIVSGNRRIINSTNTHLQFQESGTNKWHFESVGGTLNFVETGVSNRATLSPSTGNMSLLTGKLTASGGVGITSSNPLSFDTYGGGFNMTDTTWIRTYGSKSFYHNSGEFRTDGTLEVGSSGATLSVPNGGNFNYRSGVLFANTSSQVGVGTASPRNRFDVQGGGVVIGTNLQSPTLFLDGTLSIGNTAYSYSGNQNGETWTGAGDTITLHAKDYSTLAFLQANTRADYIRGGAGNIDIGYDGGWGRANVLFTSGIWNNTGSVGIGTTSPQRNLDVVGSLRVTNNIYSPSVVNMYNDSGASQGMNVGSLAISNSYGQQTAPANGLYVQGNVGINNPTPAYNLDVSGNINVSGIIYSFGNNQANFQVGNDAQLWDINVANTMGIYGVENSAVGALKLGSTGPTLYGTGNMLGIGTTSPAYTLDVVGSIRIASNSALYSGYNNNYILKDHGNGNVTVSAAGSNLYLGYQNTSQILLSAPLYASSYQVVDTTGKLYYQGQDADARYVNSTGDTMSSDLSFSNVNNGIGFTVVASGSAYKTGGDWITGGNDYAGLAKINDVAIQTWYGFSVSPTATGYNVPQGAPAFSIDARGGDAYLYRHLYLSNSNINNVTMINGQYGRIANSRSDEWLGLNDDGSHTSGVYFGTSAIRTDGTLQIGSGGSTLSIPSNGTLNWQSGNLTLTSGGALTTKGVITSTTSYGQGQGFKLDNVTIDTVVATGNIGIGGLNQLRFGTSTVWDWNQWAGIKYDSNAHYLYIGGPASSYFSANASPPSINVLFDGIASFNINGETFIQNSHNLTFSGGGINFNFPSTTGYWARGFFFNDATGATSYGSVGLYGNGATPQYLYVGYGSSPWSTDGIYILPNGHVGIGATSPARFLDVLGDTRVSGNIYGGAGTMGFLTDAGGALPVKVGSLAITSSYTNNAPTNGLYVQGSVGVGVLSPQQSIDVVGNIQNNGTFISNSTSADVFQAMGASGVKTFRWEGGNLRFWSSQVAGNEAMTLASNGNIGIYQASPSYKLDVTGDIRTTTAFRATANNTEALYVGSNSAIWDVNTANTVGVYGQQNTAVGGLKLGSTGPTLYGTGNMLGIGTTTPAYTLDINGSARIASNGAIYSAYNNNYILKDHGNGNTSVNGANAELYLGYVNTTDVRLYSKMMAQDGVTNVIGTNGTLYYQGQDTDTRYVNATGDSMTSDLSFSNQNNGIGLSVVVSGGVIKTSGSWITGGNDAVGLSKINDVAVQTWQGFSVSPTISGQNVPQGIPAFSVDARGGDAYIYRHLYMNNSDINSIAHLNGQNGLIARSIDSWLRINDTGTVHTSGVYFGTSLVRTDGTLQVGASGANLNVNSTAFNISVPNINLKTSTNGTSAFQVQNSSGTSVLSVDTTNSRIGVNNTTPASQVDIAVKSNTDGINVASFGGNTIPSGNNMLHVNANEDYNTSALYWVSGNGWTDVTNIANNNTSSTMALPSAVAPTQYLYIGNPSKVTIQNISISTIASGGVVAYDYWNGTAWASLTVTGNNNYTANSTITFTAPSDWALKAPVSNDATWGPSTTSALPSTTNMSQQYWIRMKVTTAPSSTPYANYVTPSPFSGKLVTLQNAGVNRMTMDGLGNTLFSGNVTVSGNLSGLNPYCFVRAGNYNSNISSPNTLTQVLINNYVARSYGVQNNSSSITIQQAGVYNVDFFLELSGLNQNHEADVLIRLLRPDNSYADDANYFQGWNGIGANYTYAYGAVPLTHNLMINLNVGDQLQFFARCDEAPRTINSYIIRVWKISN